MFTVMPYHLMVTWGPEEDRTIHHLLLWFAKGFRQLETGFLPKTPLENPTGAFKPRSVFAKRAGERICEDFDFSFAGSKGDLEYHQACFPSPQGFRTWRNFCCMRCMASSHLPETWYTDTSPNAGWKRTQLNTQDFLSNMTYRSPLTTLSGWHIMFILWDVMHNLYLGPGKDHIGSGVLLLAASGWFDGTNLLERLSHATQCCRNFWKKRKVYLKIKAFTPSSLHYAPRTRYPLYEGKAYMVKLVCIWLCNFTDRYL